LVPALLAISRFFVTPTHVNERDAWPDWMIYLSHRVDVLRRITP
jgi:hypothetical protein